MVVEGKECREIWLVSLETSEKSADKSGCLLWPVYEWCWMYDFKLKIGRFYRVLVSFGQCDLQFDVCVLWGLWYGVGSCMKCNVWCEFYGVLGLDMIKCTVKFYTLRRAIFRFIFFSQENKANLTVCSRITYLHTYTQECLTKSKMLPRIWHIVLLLIEWEQRLLATLTGKENLVWDEAWKLTIVPLFELFCIMTGWLNINAGLIGLCPSNELAF